MIGSFDRVRDEGAEFVGWTEIQSGSDFDAPALSAEGQRAVAQRIKASACCRSVQ
jgi:hypothetical protein